MPPQVIELTRSYQQGSKLPLAVVANGLVLDLDGTGFRVVAGPS